MNKLEQEQKRMNMSPADFAKWLDISPTTYRKILTGNVVNMYINTFIKIKKKTNLGLAEIINTKKVFKAIQDLDT